MAARAMQGLGLPAAAQAALEQAETQPSSPWYIYVQKNLLEYSLSFM
jgi:hypothetical protein